MSRFGPMSRPEIGAWINAHAVPNDASVPDGEWSQLDASLEVERVAEIFGLDFEDLDGGRWALSRDERRLVIEHDAVSAESGHALTRAAIDVAWDSTLSDDDNVARVAELLEAELHVAEIRGLDIRERLARAIESATWQRLRAVAPLVPPAIRWLGSVCGPLIVVELVDGQRRLCSLRSWGPEPQETADCIVDMFLGRGSDGPDDDPADEPSPTPGPRERVPAPW